MKKKDSILSGYVIDGLFFTQPISGIQRFSYEITKELDKIVEKDKIEILVPEYAVDVYAYQNIRVVRYGRHKGIIWQQIDYARYAKHYRKRCLCLTNIVPILWKKGIVVVHDVCYKARADFFSSLRGRISAIWHRWNYKEAFQSDMCILTDSEFSKSEIIRYYGVNEKRIHIIWNGWQHMECIPNGKSTFQKYAFLKPGTYYFSLSNLAPNKNLKWIIHAAKAAPDQIFAIAGRGAVIDEMDGIKLKELHNVYFLGYVSDEDAKTLMKECKAFVFPTLYEGFGIPPLEAVACGAKHIVVSDTPCMREVYGEFAEYIDPLDYTGNMPLQLRMVDMQELLKKYRWDESAKKLYRVLKSI